MDKAKLNSLLISSNTTIKQAMRRLNDTAEQILFVIDKEKTLIGTVTDGDIRRGLIYGILFTDKVEKIMHRSFTTIFREEPEKIEKAKNLMRQKQIEQIPILDEKGRITDLIVWNEIFENSPILKQTEFFSNPVIIMAGGKGSRLDPFTRILPKALIPIGDKPIIEIIMERFHHYGFSNFIFTLNYKKEYIKMFLKENNFPYTIDWVEENDYTGTAGSLALLSDKIKETLIVSNCDTVLDADYTDMLNWHKEQGNIATIVGCHREVEIPYGILEMDNGLLKHFVEKPNYNMLINTGVYVLEPKVIDIIPQNKPIDMNDLITLVSKKGRVSVYPIHRGWSDIGRWEEYNKNFKEISELKYKTINESAKSSSNRSG